jgi:cell division protein FtsZ
MMVYVSPDATLEDVELASTIISQEANPEANIIWGVTFDNDLDDEMRITIVATGFEKKPEDENRVIKKVETNPESPFRKEAPAKPAAAPVAQPAAKPAAPAAQPVKKPAAKPASKPADDDDFGDLFDMFKKK